MTPTTPTPQAILLREILEESDEILITGTAFSPQADFVALRCIIATIDDGTLKVWPVEPQDNGDGKIWFRVEQIQSIEPVEAAS
jgi:hypothetical protein